MVTLFNRSEVMVANDLKQIETAMQRLQDAGIESACGQERMGGNYTGVGWIYYLYVRKKDLEEARSLLGLFSGR